MSEDAIKILLVEDNPGDVTLLEQALWQVPNFQTHLTHASRLRTAGDLLRKDTFDILLLDLDLPDSKGMETLDNALLLAPALPVIVLTGRNDEEMGMAAVRHGAQDYLVKGEVDCWQLSRAIQYAIERKKTQVELHKLEEEMEHRVRQQAQQLLMEAHVGIMAERKKQAVILRKHIEPLLEKAKGRLRDINCGGKDEKNRPVVAELMELLAQTAELAKLLRAELDRPAET